MFSQRLRASGRDIAWTNKRQVYIKLALTSKATKG